MEGRVKVGRRVSCWAFLDEVMASTLSVSQFYQADGALLSSAGNLVSYKELGEGGGCPH